MAEATTIPASSRTGTRKVLRLHQFRKQYRGRSGTQEKDFSIDFLFSLTPEGNAGSGGTPGKPEIFWTEVHIRPALLKRPGWKDLPEKDRIKAMVAFAIDAIQLAGGRRPVRQLSMDWIPGAPYAEVPHWDLSRIDLKRPAPVVIEGGGITPVVVDQH